MTDEDPRQSPKNCQDGFFFFFVKFKLLDSTCYLSKNNNRIKKKQINKKVEMEVGVEVTAGPPLCRVATSKHPRGDRRPPLGGSRPPQMWPSTTFKVAYDHSNFLWGGCKPPKSAYESSQIRIQPPLIDPHLSS